MNQDCRDIPSSLVCFLDAAKHAFHIPICIPQIVRIGRKILPYRAGSFWVCGSSTFASDDLVVRGVGHVAGCGVCMLLFEYFGAYSGEALIF